MGSAHESGASPRRGTMSAVVALAALYMAQGIPFGFATEYLPVVLRESGVSYAGIAALSWLQLPWQLKIFWAKAADHPTLRSRTRVVVLVMQLALTATVAAFALRPLRSAPMLWFVLTFVAAALAATQDVFVDAHAVRVLRPEDRGFGNTAQVAGYRVGMLVGGAALLLLVTKLGEPTTLLACAGVVALASVGAFVASEDVAAERSGHSEAADPAAKAQEAIGIRALAKHALGRDTWVVLAVAVTFKLGLHMASSLLKPMAVDHGWTKQQIGAAVVSVGSAAALVGVERLHAPIGLTTAAIALEHFGSGLGTTVLFAALMTATRPANAGVHYTVLTSANALAIGFGGLLGGVCADLAGKSVTFVAATLVCLLPAVLLPRWDHAARASRT